MLWVMSYLGWDVVNFMLNHWSNCEKIYVLHWTWNFLFSMIFFIFLIWIPLAVSFPKVLTPSGWNLVKEGEFIEIHWNSTIKFSKFEKNSIKLGSKFHLIFPPSNFSYFLLKKLLTPHWHMVFQDFLTWCLNWNNKFQPSQF